MTRAARTRSRHALPVALRPRVAARMRALVDLRLAEMGQVSLVFVGLALLAAIAALNYLGGRHLSFSLLYFVPVCVVTWYGGRPMGVAFAGCSTLAWSAVDVVILAASDPSSLGHPVWNACIRMGFLLFMVVLTAGLKRANGALSDLSRIDGLTGLPNRRFLHEALENELKRFGRTGRRFSLACVDIDDFKRVNDEFGHAEGDAVLLEVARVSRTVLRSTDVFARTGGDEFVLLMPETDLSEAGVVVGALHEGFASAFARCEWDAGSSVGVITFEAPPGTPARALAYADDLARQVKATAKGGVRFALATESLGLVVSLQPS